MKSILFVLLSVSLFASHSVASETDTVVFPRVNLTQLSEITIQAVKDEVEATMPYMEWNKEIGAPTLLAVSQDQEGDVTNYELEIEIEMKSPGLPYLFESFCMIELDGSLNVLYASCEGYEPEPWD